MGRRSISVALLAACGSVLCPLVVVAQSEESELPPAPGGFQPAQPPAPSAPFIIPDVPDTLAHQLRIEEHWFTLKAGLVLIADYDAFHQDDASIAQVGRQTDQWNARAARLMFRGSFGKQYKVSYLLAGEYKGFESEPEVLWSLTDVSLTFPLGGPATKLTVGKTKETFAYEMVGDAANLPHLERVLNPFFVSRNIGVKVIHVAGAEQRMTMAAGVFNDAWTTGAPLSASGTDVTARITGLVWDRPEGDRFLHLGLAGRYAGADDSKLRYKGRPESNVTDNYVDTGVLTGEQGWNIGLEALWNVGPYSVLAEYEHASTNAGAIGDPQFSGYHITASWVISGETRPYDRTVGYARRVMPTGRWGAPELVLRFSHLDLDDGAVQGGAFNKTLLCMNWWATRRWKFGAGWGRTWLDRSSTTGITDSYQVRTQWIF